MVARKYQEDAERKDKEQEEKDASLRTGIRKRWNERQRNKKRGTNRLRRCIRNSMIKMTHLEMLLLVGL